MTAIVFSHDLIPTFVHCKTKFIFADNMSILATDEDLAIALARTKVVFDRMVNWLDSWRIEVKR